MKEIAKEKEKGLPEKTEDADIAPLKYVKQQGQKN